MGVGSASSCQKFPPKIAAALKKFETKTYLKREKKRRGRKHVNFVRKRTRSKVKQFLTNLISIR